MRPHESSSQTRSSRRFRARPQEERGQTMSVFRREGSPYYVYDFVFKGRRCRGSTKLKNKIAAGRYENNLREKLAKSRAGILDPEPPPRFKAFAEQFIERTKHEMRPNTSRCYGVSAQEPVSALWLNASRRNHRRWNRAIQTGANGTKTFTLDGESGSRLPSPGSSVRSEKRPDRNDSVCRAQSRIS